MTLIAEAPAVVRTRTADGNTIAIECRPGTSDAMMVDSIVGQDEYRLAGRSLSGWAVDVGAHIGVAAAVLLADQPGLRVVAIEPVPSNVRAIRTNLAPYGDRAVVLEAAVGADHDARTVVWHSYTDYAGATDDYVATNRFIGGLWREDPGGGVAADVPVVSLAGLMADLGIDEIALIKTDCEGGEYGFLSDRLANARVQTIVGEWHDDGAFGQRIRDLLEPTHEFVRHDREQEGITGIFEATRRTT